MSTEPSNLNYLSPVSFRLLIDKAPNVEYFCTGVNMPDLSITPSSVNITKTVAQLFADKINFNDLTVKIIIDEDMENYKEIYDWIRRTTLDDNFAESETCDISLVVMSSHNNQTNNIVFTNAFPVSIAGVEFTTEASDVTYVTADVTFSFSDMILK